MATNDMVMSDPSSASWASPESEDLLRVRSRTARHPCEKMLTSPETLRLLQLLIRSTGARRVLEIGCFTGLSALAFAEVLPNNGTVTTIDRNTEWGARAQRNWNDSVHGNKISLIFGNAPDVLAAFTGKTDFERFDFIFVDADNHNYKVYFEYALSLIRPNGIIAFDNTLQYVSRPPNEIQKPSADALSEFVKNITHDPRVFVSTVPIGEGITLCYLR